MDCIQIDFGGPMTLQSPFPIIVNTDLNFELTLTKGL